MTKRSIGRWFRGAVVYFVVLIFLGVALSILDYTDRRVVYGTFKDLIPLQIAVPAAWLTHCFQRRTAYLQQLRSLWTKLVEAVQVASQYTRIPAPTRDQHAYALSKVSMVIEEVRSLFTNLGESDTEDGLYPFEPIKDIYGLIENLGHGNQVKAAEARATRKQIHVLWKDVRRELLKEFDREKPSFAHSHWHDASKAHVYETHGIEKKPT